MKKNHQHRGHEGHKGNTENSQILREFSVPLVLSVLKTFHGVILPVFTVRAFQYDRHRDEGWGRIG